ncbi:MAG: hypothetical protein AAF125_10505 [Chloroflexota bacterium]
MITGIDRPTGGEVWINDTAIHNFTEGQMAKWRGVNLGVVFQFFQLLPLLPMMPTNSPRSMSRSTPFRARKSPASVL